MDNSPSAQQVTPSRDYKCPCGKTYLSYPAIFTHIKHKHDGIAPGPIIRPSLPQKPRGRPPLSSKKPEQLADKKKQQTKSEPQSKHLQQFRQIFLILNQIDYREYVQSSIWQNIQAFHLFETFIDGKKAQKHFQYYGVCIGIGFSQFLKIVSLETQSWRFQQLLILFILLLQYTIDQNNDKGIIESAPVEFVVEYMNPFIGYFIQDEAERLGIGHLHMMKKQIISRAFLCFYNWLKSKNYTQYCITLIG